jgi:CubicO group peptidase (beta-lactamase class C family)
MVTRRTVLVGAAAAAALAAAGCDRSRGPATESGAAPAAVPDLYYPPASGTWETIEPAAAGWVPDRLEAALDRAAELGSVSFMVLYAGRIVAERYRAGVDASVRREVASVQKSVTSALVANAAAAGHLAIDDGVSQYLGPGWSAAPAEVEEAITIRHLLSMSSGLDVELRHVAPAGERWFYNSVAYHLLHPVIEAATDTSLGDWSTRSLFAPIGAPGATWELRPPQADVAGFSLLMTAREMARFGVLVLGGGVWESVAVLPADYLRTALRPSQADNPSYGMLWWLNSAPRKSVPPAPADMVSAQGGRGQRIYVVPSMKTVVVRQSDQRSEDNRLDETLWRALMSARVVD